MTTSGEAGTLAGGGGGSKLPGEADIKMIRIWLTWVIVSALAALLLVAGLDALRPSHGETPAFTTTASTTPENATGFQSVWNVPYRFRGSKPERLRTGRGGTLG